jgi:hypothetical protein
MSEEFVLTYNISVGDVNRGAIAEEVVSSAAKVLLLAGFTEGQIGDLFQQASQQILSGAAVEQGQPDADESFFEDDGDDQGIWGIADRFENIKSVKALSRLGKRANAVDDLDNPRTLEKAVSLVNEAAGLRKESLDWLRNEATKAGIEIVSDHDQWTETATDEQLDEEGNVLFLDDYRWSGNFNWHLVGQVARALAKTGDRESLSTFSEAVLDEDLAIESGVREDVERAVGAAGQYEEFLTYVQSHAGAGELAQAEFFDKFIRASGFSSGSYALESWLEGMAKRGVVERYKRSNRWRVLVG